MVIVVENGGEALLAGSEHLVAPGTTLAEVPVAPVFAGRRVDSQVLTEHVAAADYIPRFNGGVHVAPALVAMGAGLADAESNGRNVTIQLMILKESLICDVPQPYHDLASRALAADRHAHPLHVFAFFG